MSATPWPPMLACHKCGGRGYRNLGPQGWCEQHLAELFGSFAPHIYMTDEQRLAAVMKADHDYTLTPPLGRLFGALDAWAEQLESAIDFGTITRAEADTAWRRAVRDDFAA